MTIRKHLTADEVDVLEQWDRIDVHEAKYSMERPTWISCVRRLDELSWQLWLLALALLALGPLGIHIAMMAYRREVDADETVIAANRHSAAKQNEANGVTIEFPHPGHEEGEGWTIGDAARSSST